MLVYPQTVNVRITGVAHCVPGKTYYYHTEQVPFKDYVKGVMVNEFGHVHYNAQNELVPNGNDTLMASAIAIKQFALVTHEQKGYLWDCDWDMNYKPDRTHPSTDQAVDATWDLVLLRDGELFPTYFLAWRSDEGARSLGTDQYMTAYGYTGIYQQEERGILTWLELLFYAYGDIGIGIRQGTMQYFPN